jgi:hypothetical protein
MGVARLAKDLNERRPWERFALGIGMRLGLALVSALALSVVLSGCGDYTHGCISWLDAQPETHLVYPGGIVVESSMNEAFQGIDGDSDPLAGGDIFVPRGSADAITVWYDQRLRARGWVAPADAANGSGWTKSSHPNGPRDLFYSFGVDSMAPTTITAMAPATITPPSRQNGLWVHWSFGVEPLSGNIYSNTARYVCA